MKPSRHTLPLALRLALISTLGCLILGSIASLRAPAITLSDGTTYFLNPPRLLAMRSSQEGTYIWNATYSITLLVPQNAGEPLQKLIITQRGGLGRPLFNPTNTEAFSGTPQKPGPPLPLGNVTLDPDGPILTVSFDPPVPPGTLVTLRLYPVRNPGVAGTYLYGITAFPSGETPFGQFIGIGQVRIYDSPLD